MVITEEARAYQGLEGEFDHYTFNYSVGEYMRHNYFRTNSIESARAPLKRQIIGINTEGVILPLPFGTCDGETNSG